MLHAIQYFMTRFRYTKSHVVENKRFGNLIPLVKYVNLDGKKTLKWWIFCFSTWHQPNNWVIVSHSQEKRNLLCGWQYLKMITEQIKSYKNDERKFAWITALHISFSRKKIFFVLPLDIRPNNFSIFKNEFHFESSHLVYF